ncbi:unnamed protein product, partial [Ostreobium quekettii]
PGGRLAGVAMGTTDPICGGATGEERRQPAERGECVDEGAAGSSGRDQEWASSSAVGSDRRTADDRAGRGWARRRWVPLAACAAIGCSASVAIAQAAAPVCHGVGSCASLLSGGINWMTFFAVFNLAAILDVGTVSDAGSLLGVADWAWDNEHVSEGVRGAVRYTEQRSGDAVGVTFVEVGCVTEFAGEPAWVSGSAAGGNMSVIWATDGSGAPRTWMCGAKAEALGGDFEGIEGVEAAGGGGKNWRRAREKLLARRRPDYDAAERLLREWMVHRIADRGVRWSVPGKGWDWIAPFEVARDEWMDRELVRLFADNGTVAVAIANAGGVNDSVAVRRGGWDASSGAGPAARASSRAGREASAELCVGDTAKAAEAGINLCRGGSLMLDRRQAAGLTLQGGAVVRREFVGVAGRSGVFPSRRGVVDSTTPRPAFRPEDDPGLSIAESGVISFHPGAELRAADPPIGADACAATFYGPLRPGVPYGVDLVDGTPGPDEPVLSCDVSATAVPVRLLKAAEQAVEANLVGGRDRPVAAPPSEIASAWLFGSLAAAQLGWWVVCGLHRLQDALYLAAQASVSAYAKAQGADAGVPRLRRLNTHVHVYMSFYTDWYLNVRASTLRTYAAGLAILAAALTYGVAAVPIVLQMIEQVRHDAWAHRTAFSLRTGDGPGGPSGSLLLATVERRMAGSTAVWTGAACVVMALQAVVHAVLMFRRIREEQTAQELLVEDAAEGRKSLFEKLRSIV